MQCCIALFQTLLLIIFILQILIANDIDLNFIFNIIKNICAYLYTKISYTILQNTNNTTQLHYISNNNTCNQNFNKSDIYHIQSKIITELKYFIHNQIQLNELILMRLKVQEELMQKMIKNMESIKLNLNPDIIW